MKVSRFSRKESRYAPWISTSSILRVTDFRRIAAGRCSTPTRWASKNFTTGSFSSDGFRRSFSLLQTAAPQTSAHERLFLLMVVGEPLHPCRRREDEQANQYDDDEEHKQQNRECHFTPSYTVAMKYCYA